MSRSLETRFDMLIEQLATHILPAELIHPLVDLTCLDEQADQQVVDALVSKAQQEKVAAVCVYPQHLAWIPSLNAIQRATVVNFPGGNMAHEQVLRDIEQAITQQYADEIDYVFAYPHYLAGKTSHALDWCTEAHQLCKQHGRMFKVILETGALSSINAVYQISSHVLEAGCDMLKTSTGKINIGASLQAAFAILTAIKESQRDCGIKISGGIKNLAQASTYVHLSEHMLEKAVDKNWFRIGASRIG